MKGARDQVIREMQVGFNTLMVVREKTPSSSGRSTALVSMPMATLARRRAAASRSFLRCLLRSASALSLERVAGRDEYDGDDRVARTCQVS